MSVQAKIIGQNASRQDIILFTVKNSSGVTVELLNLGAMLNSIYTADKNGIFKDILLGYDTVENHLSDSSYQGKIVGRYANRIAKGKFSIDGTEYQLTLNEKDVQSLHGGGEFSYSIWDTDILDESSVKFKFFSPDGSNGFPGNMTATVIYTLTEENELKISYDAVCDKACVMNFTNHAYFNLGGYDSGNILGHVAKINADRYTPTDELSIPLGTMESVVGTPFDFREFKVIGKEIDADFEQLTLCGGYDHNFCLNNNTDPAATVYEPESGRAVEVYTDLPGIQLYCGNFLKGADGKNGSKLGYRNGFCLETQYFPDTPNQPDFPQCTFQAGEHFISETRFRFYTI